MMMLICIKQYLSDIRTSIQSNTETELKIALLIKKACKNKYLYTAWYIVYIYIYIYVFLFTNQSISW